MSTLINALTCGITTSGTGNAARQSKVRKLFRQSSQEERTSEIAFVFLFIHYSIRYYSVWIGLRIDSDGTIMRNHIMIIIVSFVFLLTALGVNAQMMGGFFNTSADWDEVVEHTVREEQEGKELWKKFQSEAVVCANFSDEQFGVLGEYFMGRMTGDSHAAMNAMMIQAHGEDGEEQIHIVMGKRLSGCDTHASIYGISGGWILIMNMMMGSSMMNFGYGFGYIGWIFMILWWVLLIAGIIALVKWLTGQSSDKGHRTNKSALEILKERYAKGEIEKKEFEKRKKDLI